jgi:hypothetical protein
MYKWCTSDVHVTYLSLYIYIYIYIYIYDPQHLVAMLHDQNVFGINATTQSCETKLGFDIGQWTPYISFNL